jgi:hypothetical protein
MTHRDRDGDPDGQPAPGEHDEPAAHHRDRQPEAGVRTVHDHRRRHRHDEPAAEPQKHRHGRRRPPPPLDVVDRAGPPDDRPRDQYRGDQAGDARRQHD